MKKCIGEVIVGILLTWIDVYMSTAYALLSVCEKMKNGFLYKHIMIISHGMLLQDLHHILRSYGWLDTDGSMHERFTDLIETAYNFYSTFKNCDIVKFE